MKKHLLPAICVLLLSPLCSLGQNFGTNLKFLLDYDNGDSLDYTLNTSLNSFSGATATTDRNGHADKAMAFDGTSQNAYSASSSLALGSDDFSVAFWFKTSNTNRQCPIMIGEYDGGTNNQRIGIEFNHPSGKLYAYTSNSTNTTRIVSSSTDVSDNLWHHLVLTRSGAALSIYLDGALESSTNVAIDNLNLPLSKIYVGSLFNGNFDVHYQGSLDDVFILDKALSTDEITNLSNTNQEVELSSTSKNVVFYCPILNAATDDIIGTGIMRSNTASYATGADLQTNGALSFDGSNYVHFDIDKSLQSGVDDFGISAWFKTSSNHRQTLFSIGRYSASGNSSRINVELFSSASDSIRLSIANSSNVTEHLSLQTENPISDNNWHHVFSTRAGNRLILHLDGQEIGFVDIAEINLTNDLELVLGGLQNPNPGVLFTGELDDVIVFNGPISREIIANAYNMVDFTPESALGSDLLFENTFEGSIADLTGNSTQDNGTVSYVSGGSSSSMAGSFDGSSSYARYAASQDLVDLYTTDFSISTWIKSNSGARQSIFELGQYPGAGQSSGNGRLLLEINHPSGEEVRLTLVDDAGNDNSMFVNESVHDNEWHNITITKESETYSIFVDGVKLGQKKMSTVFTNANHPYFYIGALSSPAPSVFFNGSIDDVIIYPRVLNKLEIVQNATEPGLITSVINFSDKSDNMVLFPNPATDEVQIIGEDNIGDYEIFSIDGANVMNGSTTNGIIPLNGITKGLYLLRINNSMTKFLIK